MDRESLQGRPCTLLCHSRGSQHDPFSLAPAQKLHTGNLYNKPHSKEFLHTEPSFRSSSSFSAVAYIFARLGFCNNGRHQESDLSLPLSLRRLSLSSCKGSLSLQPVITVAIRGLARKPALCCRRRRSGARFLPSNPHVFASLSLSLLHSSLEKRGRETDTHSLWDFPGREGG